MYEWRRMSQVERDAMLQSRQQSGLPWHSPPHSDMEDRTYLLSAACFEHKPHIGAKPHRMAEFESHLLQAAAGCSNEIYAWCVLPNHYHLLAYCEDVKAIRKSLGKLHGRTSYYWNGEENARGRQVWYECADRYMRSEGHFWASLNYVHHNPVHHGYCIRWQEWPFSSAARYLEETAREEAIRIWTAYPIKEYGKGWDDPNL